MKYFKELNGWDDNNVIITSLASDLTGDLIFVTTKTQEKQKIIKAKFK